MSIKTNASIVTGGLVFDMDLASTRSYTGPAIRNIATSITQNYGNQSNSTFQLANGTEVVNIPTLGKVTSKYVDIYNDYNGGSGQCCPSLFSYGSNLATNASTVHTYAIVYKSVNGYTHPNYMYRYEYNGATYVLEGGILNNTNRIHLGDDWYWAWGTFTTNAATTKFNYIAFFMYEYAKYNRLYVAKVLLCQGDYTTLHPSLWPEVNTTKSSSGAFKDLLNSSMVSDSNVTYAANGSVTFNGSSNYIRLNNNTALDTQTPSIEVWVKTNATTQNGFWFEKGTVNSQYALFQEGASIRWRMNIGGITQLSATTASFMNTSDWFQIVGTYESGTRKLYINGVEVASDSQTGTIATNSGGMTIGEYGGGAYRYNGSIDVVRVYNRVLTAEEVAQNFNAFRGRYGI